MNESGLAHHARRRRHAPRHANDELAQLRVRRLQLFRRRALALSEFGHVLLELADDRCNRVLALFALGQVSALELVRVSVADEFTNPFKVLAARARLVVVFDDVSEKWRAHSRFASRRDKGGL